MVLRMVVHPAETGEPWECKTWLKKIVGGAALVCLPEIADYEFDVSSADEEFGIDQAPRRTENTIALRPYHDRSDAQSRGTVGGGKECGKPTVDDLGARFPERVAAVSAESLLGTDSPRAGQGFVPIDNGGHVMPTVTFDIPAGALACRRRTRE
jgi:hypothetical protein